MIKNLRNRKMELESTIFDIIVSLNNNYFIKNLDGYKVDLVLLDEYNEEYKDHTGIYYIKPEKVITYYEKLWET